LRIKPLAREDSQSPSRIRELGLTKSADLRLQLGNLLQQAAFGPATILNGYVKPVILSRNAVHILSLTATLERLPAAEIACPFDLFRPFHRERASHLKALVGLDLDVAERMPVGDAHCEYHFYLPKRPRSPYPLGHNYSVRISGAHAYGISHDTEVLS
jgi:hypothetical protein